MLWPRGLRGRFAVCFIAATLPLLAVLFAALSFDGRQMVRNAEWQALQAARLGAMQEQAAIEQAASMLHGLVQAPALGCDAVLAKARAGLPDAVALAVTDGDGAVRCAAGPDAAGMAPGQAALQQAVNLADGTGFIVGRSGKGRPLLIVAARLPAGAAYAALSLDTLALLPADLEPADGATIEVLDRTDGTVLAHFPGDRLAGVSLPDHPGLQAARAQPGGGTIEAPDVDGIPRLFAFAPIPANPALLVAIGLKAASVRHASEQRLALAMAIGLVVAAFAIAVAWALARQSVVLPLRALSAAAVRLGAGKASATVMPNGTPGEVQALAGVVARMGKRLQVRDYRIEVMQRDLQDSEREHRLLTETVNDVLSRYSADRRRVYISPACRELLGYEPAELLGGVAASVVHADDRPRVDAMLIEPLLRDQLRTRATFRVIRKDGAQVWVESSGRNLGQGQGFVVATRDVTERKLLEDRLAAANAKLQRLASQDCLTGLANRRQFDTAIAAEYRRLARSCAPLSVILLDVDCFKLFNDTYGHPAGDACLQSVAGVIERALHRPADLACRYGGEEFAVLLPEIDVDGAFEVASRIREGLRAANLAHAASSTGRVTVSIGIAARRGPVPPDPAALVMQADAALYRAKREGRDRICCASDGSDAPAVATGAA